MGPLQVLPGKSEPTNNVNEGVSHIPQSSRAGVLPLDGLVSYPEHFLGRGF